MLDQRTTAIRVATDVGGTFTDLVSPRPIRRAGGRHASPPRRHHAAGFRARHPRRARQGAASISARFLRPRHDRGDQCADGAQGRQDRARHDRGLSRRPRDRARQPAGLLRLHYQKPKLRAARSAPRSGRAHVLRGEERSRSISPACRRSSPISARGVEAVAICLLHAYANRRTSRRRSPRCAALA